jgi:hypothetical protein
MSLCWKDHISAGSKGRKKHAYTNTYFCQNEGQYLIRMGSVFAIEHIASESASVYGLWKASNAQRDDQGKQLLDALLLDDY